MRDKHNPYSTSAEALKPDFNRRLLYRRASVAEARVKELEAKLAVAIEALRIVAGFTQQMTSMRGNSTFDQMKRSREVCKKALDKIGEKVE